MSDYKLVPVEPTAEMVVAAEDAYMPFGDMDLALRMAILAAPAVQGEPVACEVVGRAYHESFGSGVRLKLYIDAHQWPIAEAIPIGTKLYFRPQPTEQQPELAKYQPCGCVICTCEHETQCQGCGARHCGTHPLAQLYEPAYQQPAPDVTQLVEALEASPHRLHDIIDGEDDCLCSQCDFVRLRDAAIAAYRKQQEVEA